MKSGAEFFAAQSYTGVAEEDVKIYGLYMLELNQRRARKKRHYMKIGGRFLRW